MNFEENEKQILKSMLHDVKFLCYPVRKSPQDFFLDVKSQLM